MTCLHEGSGRDSCGDPCPQLATTTPTAILEPAVGHLAHLQAARAAITAAKARNGT